MSEKVSITKSKLDSLANAIASVGETSVPKTIAQMESAVLELTIPPNLQSKTITPSLTQQIVSPDSGYDAFSQVTVDAIKLQEKTVTPTTEQQIVTPDSIEYVVNVPVNTANSNRGSALITWNISSASFDSSTLYETEGEFTFSDGTVVTLSGSTLGGWNIQPNFTYSGPSEVTYIIVTSTLITIEFNSAPEAGVVSKAVKIWATGQEEYDGLSKVTVNAIPSGTAGTPTATKGTVSNHSISITPSVTNTTGYITGGTINGTPITVNVAELESGTKTITESGTGISVSGYSTVDVAVQAGTIIDDGDGNINLSPTGEVAVITPLTVNQNGTYTAPSNTGYSPVTVNVESSTAGEKDVNFIDYDGTVLYSYTATEAQTLTELPANPSHDRLTAQGWNWTLTQIKNQLTNVGGKVWVGQMYTTVSGATEIDIELDNPDYLSPYLTIAVNGTVSIDWGDGTATSTATGTSTASLTYTLHEYATIGSYTIKISVVSGSFALYNNSSSTAAILSVYGVDSNRRYSRTYAETVKRIFIGYGASIRNYAFANCCALQSITVPSSVTSIGANAFNRCYALQSIIIPDEIISIGTSVFQNDYALQSIAIPSSVTSIGSNAFNSCYALQSITIPSSVTNIWDSAFSSCYALQSITIPSSVTSIETFAFSSCYSLQSITIPSSVTSIGSYAFQNNYVLQSIIIPDEVTSIETYAFQYCYSLQSITIPSDVTSILNGAFQYCYGVEEYHITPTTPPTLSNTNAFSGIVSGTIIYVPSESLEAYQTATNWSTYASYMRGE